MNRAYQVLSDDKQRALYDEFGEEGLREGFDAEAARAYGQRRRAARGRGGGVPVASRRGHLLGRGGNGSGGLGDLFGDLFGGGRGRGAPRCAMQGIRYRQ